jgi:hypothetical protein
LPFVSWPVARKRHTSPTTAKVRPSVGLQRTGREALFIGSSSTRAGRFVKDPGEVHGLQPVAPATSTLFMTGGPVRRRTTKDCIISWRGRRKAKGDRVRPIMTRRAKVLVFLLRLLGVSGLFAVHR